MSLIDMHRLHLFIFETMLYAILNFRLVIVRILLILRALLVSTLSSYCYHSRELVFYLSVRTSACSSNSFDSQLSVSLCTDPSTQPLLVFRRDTLLGESSILASLSTRLKNLAQRVVCLHARGVALSMISDAGSFQ